MANGNLKGSGSLTIVGKRTVALSWYEKGKSFIAAALLLRRHGGDEYVVLHLLCQGVEVILKALLVFSDYDQFQPKLKGPFGHNLVAIAETAICHFHVRKLEPVIALELRGLNNFYSQHLLRYGSIVDLFILPNTIDSRRVLRKISAVIKVANRHVHL